MKIAYKLPMSAELSTSLRDMDDADAGAAFKAALAYQAGRAVPALPAGARAAFEGMRGLIDLSRKRARAGAKGGSKRNIADLLQAKNSLLQAKQLETRTNEPTELDIGDFDVSAELELFM